MTTSDYLINAVFVACGLLLDEVAALALNDVPVPEQTDDSWAERLAQIIGSLQAGLS